MVGAEINLYHILKSPPHKMISNILFFIGIVYLSVVTYLILVLRPSKELTESAEIESRWFEDEKLKHEIGSPKQQICELYEADAKEASMDKHPMSLRLRIILIAIGIGLLVPRIVIWFS